MKNRKRGFTLVEIIIIIVVLVAIAGLFAVNMISTLKRNKDDETKSIVAQIKSAADAYVVANPDEVERLYNGYGYVDIKIGELRDRGFLSEDLKEAETGEIISDDEIVRVKLDIGDFFNFIFPLTLAEKNAEAWALVAEDLSLEYDPSTSSSEWCKNDKNIFSGLYDSKYVNKSNYAEVTSKLYLMDNSNEGRMFEGDYFKEARLEKTSCNVDPKRSGTYNITYKYTDPSLKTEKTVNRTVYVKTSTNDAISFTAKINNGSIIALGARDVPITITETYKDGSTATFESTTETINSINYTIEKFDTSVSGTFKAIVSTMKVNSDGSKPEPQQPEYAVTDYLAYILSDLPECTASSSDVEGCYFRGEQDGNYVDYYGKIFRAYYSNKNSNVVRIVYDGDYTIAPYGQLGECISTGCCNNGRYAYIALGDTTASSRFKKVMDSYLDDFYNLLNNGKTLTYLRSQTFTSYYNVEEYSLRTNNSYYNGLNVAGNIITNGIKTKNLSKKVALLSLGDYKEIADCSSDSSCRSATNYLTGDSKFWLLDFYAARFGVGAHNRGINPAEIYEYAVNEDGSITYDGTTKAQNASTSQIQTSELGVRPTLELGAARVKGGNGSKNNPYIVKVD